MKVTTDGCIFGALIREVTDGNILDIGTGTGLLSLMLAQRTGAQIDAIEINSSVADQAARNVSNSPWKDRIKVETVDLNNFHPSATYDQIVCNPPFFKNNYKGSSQLRNSAIHNDQLSMETLAKKSFDYLKPNGNLWVMYPEYEMAQFTEHAQKLGFEIGSKTEVLNKEESEVFRVVTEFVKGKTSTSPTSRLVIKESDNSYTENFINLLKDYYLHL